AVRRHHTLRTDGEDEDIRLDWSAPADASLAMAFKTRSGVEDRPQAVAAAGQRIARRPFMLEQVLSSLRHGCVNSMAARPPPVGAAVGEWDRQQKAQRPANDSLPLHGKTSLPGPACYET